MIGAGAAIFGAQAKTNATNQQVDLSKQVFAQQQANEQPWLDAGKQALTTLSTGVQNGTYDLSNYSYNDLITDPGYQFRLQQGENALDTAAAARGKFISGDQLKAVSDYGQQSASQEFQNAFARTQSERNDTVNNLTNLANMGSTAAGATNAAGSNMLASTSAAIGDQGNAAATGAADVATAANTGIENYMLYNRLQTDTAPTTTNPTGL